MRVLRPVAQAAQRLDGALDGTLGGSGLPLSLAPVLAGGGFSTPQRASSDFARAGGARPTVPAAFHRAQ